MNCFACPALVLRTLRDTHVSEPATTRTRREFIKATTGGIRQLFDIPYDTANPSLPHRELQLSEGAGSQGPRWWMPGTRVIQHANMHGHSQQKPHVPAIMHNKQLSLLLVFVVFVVFWFLVFWFFGFSVFISREREPGREKLGEQLGRALIVYDLHGGVGNHSAGV